MDNRMLALWSTPFSAAADFGAMMSRRGDFRCVSEPFGVPYYRGADRRTTRFDQNAQDMSVTYASTWGDLQREQRKGRVFIHDHPNHILHLADEAFLGEFHHTFLIEDPATALPAMYERWSTFTMDECSFLAMRQLFDAVAQRTGNPPVVIDSTDLAVESSRTTEAYCKAVEIPFIESVLTNTNETSPTPSTSVDDVPFLRDMYDRCMPHYETLAQFKL